MVELLEVAGASAMSQQVMQMLSAQLRPTFPSVPEAFWSELIESLDTDELSKLTVPIYANH